MKDMKPVAWSWFYITRHCTLDEDVANELMGDGVDVSPLYALPEGHVIMPEEPAENQWSGLARHLMMWLDLNNRPTGKELYSHLDMLGIDPPAWLLEEISNTNTVPSKGTRVAVIYKAMLKAAQEKG